MGWPRGKLRKPLRDQEKSFKYPLDAPQLCAELDPLARRSMRDFFDGSEASYKFVFSRFLKHYPYPGEKCILCGGPPRMRKIIEARGANRKNSSDHVTCVRRRIKTNSKRTK